MISEIFIISIILQYPQSDTMKFQDLLSQNLGNNIPEGIKLLEIDYTDDPWVNTFFNVVFEPVQIKEIRKIAKERSALISTGFFKIKFESENSMENTSLPWLETFIAIQHAPFCQEHSFANELLTSFFYPVNETFRYYGYCHNIYRDEELDNSPEFSIADNYLDFFREYCQTSELPEGNLHSAAKLLLLENC